MNTWINEIWFEKVALKCEKIVEIEIEKGEKLMRIEVFNRGIKRMINQWSV